MKRIIVLVLMFFFLISFVYAADIPKEINYQGYVTSGGSAFGGTGYFKFSLVDDKTTPTINYWTNDGSTPAAGEAPTNPVSTTVSSGVFNIILGDTTVTNMTVIPTSVFSSYSTIYLRVWFRAGASGSFELLSPDKKITSSAFAYRASTVESSIQDAIKIGPYHTDSGDTGELRYLELAAGGTNYVGFKSPDSIGTNKIWVLPNADGSNGQVLTTDGSSALSWSTPAGTGANTSLSNLAAVVSINQSLVADSSGHDLGSAVIGWQNVYSLTVKLNGSTSGTTTLQPSAVAGTNTLTLPATTDDTLVGKNTSDILTNKTLTSPTIGTSPTAAGATWTDLGSVTTADINGGTIDGTTIGGTGAGAITGTTITANTNFVPDANDGAGLGLSGTAFSDLFLASGGVINWNAGNYTITHSSGLLTTNGALTITGALAGVTTLGMAGDLTDYEATNDASPSIFLGSAAAERLEIQSVYDAGAQTLNYVQFQTYAASAAADKGKYIFGVDGTDIFSIVDAGTTTVTSSTINRNGVLETPADGALIYNNAAATVALDEFSPALRFHGSGWKTDPVAGPQNLDWRIYLESVTGVANPTSKLDFDVSVNDGAFANKAYLTSGGTFYAIGDIAAGTNLSAQGGQCAIGIYSYMGTTNKNSFIASGTGVFCSDVADGATAIGMVIGNQTAFVTAGAKLVSIRNATVEKAYIDYLGSFNAGAGTVSLPSLAFLGDPDTGLYSPTVNQLGFAVGGSQLMLLQGTTLGMITNGGFQGTYLNAHAGNGLQLLGSIVDGGTAIGAKIGNYNTLSTAGAKIVSFYPNYFTAEKACIDLNGTFGSAIGAVTLGVGADTFAAAGNSMVITGDGGTNTVATITGGVTGQRLILLFVDGLVTITDTSAHTANTVDLSAAFTSADDTVLEIFFDGTSWYEVSRSVN